MNKPPAKLSIGDENCHAYDGDPTRFYVVEDKTGEIAIKVKESPLKSINCRRILDGPFETRDQAVENIPEGKRRMKLWGPVFYQEPDFGFDPTKIDWYGESTPKVIEAEKLSVEAIADFEDMESFEG